MVLHVLLLLVLGCLAKLLQELVLLLHCQRRQDPVLVPTKREELEELHLPIHLLLVTPSPNEQQQAPSGSAPTALAKPLYKCKGKKQQT